MSERAALVCQDAEYAVTEVTKWETMDGTQFSSNLAACLYQAIMTCNENNELIAEVLEYTANAEGWN